MQHQELRVVRIFLVLRDSEVYLSQDFYYATFNEENLRWTVFLPKYESICWKLLIIAFAR